MPQRKKSRRLRSHHRLAFRLALVLAVFVVAAALYFQFESAGPRILPALVSDNKAQILAVASSNEPLTDSERELLFASLSGERMLNYRFSDAEKALIVKTINNRKAPRQKSSSDTDVVSEFVPPEISTASVILSQ